MIEHERAGFSRSGKIAVSVAVSLVALLTGSPPPARVPADKAVLAAAASPRSAKRPATRSAAISAPASSITVTGSRK